MLNLEQHSRVIGGVALSLLLSGCLGTAIRNSAHGEMTTQFISDPAGAGIEVNGNYIGNTPLSYTWPWKYRDGADFRDKVTIRAFPSGSGQFPQRKFFDSGWNKSPIPTRVYFDMRQRPSAVKDEDQ